MRVSLTCLTIVSGPTGRALAGVTVTALWNAGTPSLTWIRITRVIHCGFKKYEILLWNNYLKNTHAGIA